MPRVPEGVIAHPSAPQFPAEQFHARLRFNNTTRLSRIDWLWSAKRASVGSRRNPPPGQTGTPTHAHLHHRQRRNHAVPQAAGDTLNDGEIAIASNEELHAAPLSAKRLLALWNALPGVEKRKKVGDRDALIDQLWSAIELLPVPAQAARRTSPRCAASDQTYLIASRRVLRAIDDDAGAWVRDNLLSRCRGQQGGSSTDRIQAWMRRTGCWHIPMSSSLSACPILRRFCSLPVRTRGIMTPIILSCSNFLAGQAPRANRGLDHLAYPSGPCRSNQEGR